jgi:hypothetical protein
VFAEVDSDGGADLAEVFFGVIDDGDETVMVRAEEPIDGVSQLTAPPINDERPPSEDEGLS